MWLIAWQSYFKHDISKGTTSKPHVHTQIHFIVWKKIKINQERSCKKRQQWLFSVSNSCFSRATCPYSLIVPAAVTRLLFNSCLSQWKDLWPLQNDLPLSCPTTCICSKPVQRWCKHLPTIRLLRLILCARTHTPNQVHIKTELPPSRVPDRWR